MHIVKLIQRSAHGDEHGGTAVRLNFKRLCHILPFLVCRCVYISKYRSAKNETMTESMKKHFIKYRARTKLTLDNSVSLYCIPEKYYGRILMKAPLDYFNIKDNERNRHSY